MRNLIAYPDHARVWIYQGNRTVNESDVGRVNALIDRFTESWSSHKVWLPAIGGLLHDRFIVFVVDESQYGVSGCSIDSSVAFVKELGGVTGIDFMERMQVAYLEDDIVKTLPARQVREALKDGSITPDTQVFNNLVNTKGDFVDGWVAPLRETWMKRFL